MTHEKLEALVTDIELYTGIPLYKIKEYLTEYHKILLEDFTSEINSWNSVTDKEMERDKYWQGYSHACIDASVVLRFQRQNLQHL